MKPQYFTIATSLPGSGNGESLTTERLYITAEALSEIAATVGATRPESGGMLFGPADLGGIDTFEFDSAGSARASAVIYRPDEEWANRRQQHHIDADDQRVLDGFAHSHPGDSFWPSKAVGYAEGDLGFAAAAFEMNAHLLSFWLPIITRTKSRNPVLWPWHVSRNEPHVAQLAQVVVCAAREFPARVYPDEIAQLIGATTPTKLAPVVGLDLDYVSEIAGIQVLGHDRLVTVSRQDATVEIYLPDRFPAEPPLVAIRQGGSLHVLPSFWKSRSPMAVEWRLGVLIQRAFSFAQEL